MSKYKLEVTPVDDTLNYEVQLYKRKWILFIPYWGKYKDTVYDQLPYGANARYLQNKYDIPEDRIIFNLHKPNQK